MKLQDGFEEWWDDEASIKSHPTNNYREDSAAYWAYQGWVNGYKFARKSIQEANRLDRKEKRQRYAENKARRSE